MTNYLAFDLEIEKIVPGEFSRWKSHRPLGISCAATKTGADSPVVWHGKTPDGEISDRMSKEEVVELVRFLQESVGKGFTILTWNGLGFDFDILAEESIMPAVCRELALHHVDMMFHIFCVKGYGIALDKVAKGMGLPGKTPGMSGDKAPIYWEQGKRQEVMEYVAQDARTTLDIAQAADVHKQIRWTSRRGKPQILPIHGGWRTVQEALKLPVPDTSWMDRPWSRDEFTRWLTDK